jgi:DNA processing protein
MESSEIEAWIRLNASGLSVERQLALIEVFGSPLGILAAEDGELTQIEGMTAIHVRKLRQTCSEAQAAAIRERLITEGWSLIPITDPGYPALLREIPSPPPVLFVEGELGAPDQLAVGVVGTRKSTPYGRQVARRMGYELAARGLTVVSGMALGIDGEAHEGALEAGGRTIAVLGCGLDITYPSQHRDLRSQIAQQGAVLTELPFGTEPAKEQFPRRNRIISGLCSGVVVVEAPAGSGALITARLAAEQGRQVFAVPGDVGRPESRGCNELIRDGAILVQSVDDVLDGLGVAIETVATSPQAAIVADLPPDEAAVYNILAGETRTVDEIVAATGIDVARTMTALMLLEVKGLVRRFGGGTYGRKE